MIPIMEKMNPVTVAICSGTIENPMIYNYIDDNMPDWAKEAVRWCVDNGIIVGTGSGLGLDDTKLWTCVVMYRLSKTLK